MSCKKLFLKFLQNSLKYIGDTVFNLKFQAKKPATLLKRDSDISVFLRISQVLRTFIFLKAERLLLLKPLLLLEKVVKDSFAEKDFLAS